MTSNSSWRSDTSSRPTRYGPSLQAVGASLNSEGYYVPRDREPQRRNVDEGEEEDFDIYLAVAKSSRWATYRFEADANAEPETPRPRGDRRSRSLPPHPDSPLRKIQN